MRKIISLYIALALIVSNLSVLPSSVTAANKYNADVEYPESIEQLLSEFFTSEEYIESITQTSDIPAEILANSHVVEELVAESELVQELLAQDVIVHSIAEISSLVSEILKNKDVSNAIAEDSALVNKIIQSDGVARLLAEDASLVNELFANDSIVHAIAQDKILVREIFNSESTRRAIAENSTLIKKLFENESIIKAIVEDPLLINEILAYDHVVQSYLHDEKIVDLISLNDPTLHSLLHDGGLLDSLLTEPEMAEEIKSDLLASFNDEMGAILGEDAQKIKTSIANLDSHGIAFQLDISTDEYTSTLIIASTLDGNSMTVSSEMAYGDKVEKADYEVEIVENTTEQFTVLLVDRTTGKQITISENDAHASVVSVVVRLIGGAIKFISKRSGKEITKSAAKHAKKSFSSGTAAEKYLETLVKSKEVHSRRNTDLGLRIIDVLDTSGIAHESKVGYVTLTKFVKKQIDKDYLLVKGTTGDAKEIKGAKWHFFKSDQTGKVGASKAVLKYLKSKGIPYKIYD
ncbi:hypothetical protein [Lysinibacillus sp. 38-6]|uniref:hypothetical protein n=1 Tax=Lysinibacillus sp. 38-6 TaxID=3385991 RepID=UPI003908AD36